MKNTLAPTLGIILLSIACTAEVERVEDLDGISKSDFADGPFDTISIDDDVVAPVAGVSVPAELRALAEALLPSDARRNGYFLHFESLGTTDEIERFRVTYGSLEPAPDGLRTGAPKAVTELEFDHHAATAIACHTGDCSLDSVPVDDASAWRPIDALTAPPDPTSALMTVVTFYTNANYGGAPYGLTFDVTNTGLFLLGVPNAVNVGYNDVWSSFRTFDAVCPGCQVNGKLVDAYDVSVHRDAYFGVPMKSFGPLDSDPNFADDMYSGGGSVDNSVSAFKVSLAVYDPPPCGNGICGPGESHNNCPQDCPPVCGDGICEGEDPYTCPDCACPPDDLYCLCSQQGYQGVCASAPNNCCNSNMECGSKWGQCWF